MKYVFKFFDNLNAILCKQMRLMFTYFSSKLQVSSNIVKTNGTRVYIVCLPNLQHLHTLIFILKLKLVLWFMLSVILLSHVFGIQNSCKLLFYLTCSSVSISSFIFYSVDQLNIEKSQSCKTCWTRTNSTWPRIAMVHYIKSVKVNICSR